MIPASNETGDKSLAFPDQSRMTYNLKAIWELHVKWYKLKYLGGSI